MIDHARARSGAFAAILLGIWTQVARQGSIGICPHRLDTERLLLAYHQLPALRSSGEMPIFRARPAIEQRHDHGHKCHARQAILLRTAMPAWHNLG
jgi:hypothetical protein